jgi:hypothetical protein
MSHRKALPARYVVLAVALTALASLGVRLASGQASSPGALLQQGAKLTGGTEEIGEGGFGHGVALSAEGDVAVIGTPHDAGELGAAWVFTRSGSTWSQQGAKLTAGTEEIGEGRFGSSVALSADGNVALIGALRDDSGRGAVWVFTRSGSTWTRDAKLTGGDEESPNGWFGNSVALSADGNTALVGATVDHGDSGAVWVFTRSGSTWTRDAKLTGGTEETGTAWFGADLALSEDGNTALVGDPADNGKLGAVWVFTRNGSSWSQQGTKLTGGEEGNEGRFGSSVALSADGDTAMIGGRSEDGKMGAVWVFTSSGSSWSQQGTRLTGSIADEGSDEEEDNEEEVGQGRFGSAVALSADGATALISARDDSKGLGAAWIYTRSGTTWTRQGAKLTGGEEKGKGQFGSSVALSADGETALIGGETDASKVGAVWVFAALPSSEPSPEGSPAGGSQTAGGTSTTSTSSSAGRPSPQVQVEAFKTSSGHVALLSTRIVVRRGRRASISLRCISAVACGGKLKLTIAVRRKHRAARRSRYRTISLGSGAFSLAAGKQSIVKLKLDTAASTRLRASHRRLAANLTIAVSAPVPSTQIHLVQLVRQARHRATRGMKAMRLSQLASSVEEALAQPLEF